MVSGTNANGEISTYTYNGLGYLVNNTSAGVSTDYVIDYTSAYQDVLAKYEAGRLNYRNVYGLDRISTTVTDSLNPANSLKAYIQNDRLGSGRYAYDGSGNLVGFTDLDEWGKVFEKLVPVVGVRHADILNNFTNHEFDDVLGVYYAKARLYDPLTSRMISPDSKWNPYNRIYGDNPNRIVPDIHAIRQSENLYAYVLSNPLKYVDPWGLDAIVLNNGELMD
jgi:RHS repeat-associated protein